jgi:hypothetical protein
MMVGNGGNFEGSSGLSGVIPIYHRTHRERGDFLKVFLCGLRDLCGEKKGTPPNTKEPF